MTLERHQLLALMAASIYPSQIDRDDRPRQEAIDIAEGMLSQIEAQYRVPAFPVPSTAPASGTITKGG